MRILEGLDVCELCQWKIVEWFVGQKTACGKTLRPFCKACGGTGKVDDPNEPAGHHYDRGMSAEVDCEACLL